MIHRLLREPLVHFLVLGGLLFGLYQWLGGPAASAGGGEIVVTEGRVRNLTDTFTRTWQRPPTGDELNGLVEDYIREEVLYREGVALGLDRDDTIIRRRLRQKLEFVSEDAASALEPTDAELTAFLATNADRYRVESRLTFSQVFLDPSKRGDRLEADAAGLLDALRDARRPGRSVHPRRQPDARPALRAGDRRRHHAAVRRGVRGCPAGPAGGRVGGPGEVGLRGAPGAHRRPRRRAGRRRSPRCGTPSRGTGPRSAGSSFWTSSTRRSAVATRCASRGNESPLIRASCCLAVLLGLASAASAHEVRPAYLEMIERSPDTWDVLFKVPAAGEDLRFGLYLQLPADVRARGPAEERVQRPRPRGAVDHPAPGRPRRRGDRGRGPVRRR